jgi:SAM-dependent methyltransferase
MGKLTDAANYVITRIKRRHRMMPVGNPVKVNFGSSLFVQEGWVNVEGSFHGFFANWPELFIRTLYRHSKASQWFGSEQDYVTTLRTHTFVHHELDYGLPFPDNTVDYVYASHILEHFFPDVAEFILRDAHRVLKKSGRIRICVPDLEHVVNLYQAGKKREALYFFFRDSKAGKFYRHRYMYDFELLKAALEKAGFNSVERLAYRQGRVPDIDKLDNRPEETLYVEAVK